MFGRAAYLLHRIARRQGIRSRPVATRRAISSRAPRAALAPLAAETPSTCAADCRCGSRVGPSAPCSARVRLPEPTGAPGSVRAGDVASSQRDVESGRRRGDGPFGAHGRRPGEGVGVEVARTQDRPVQARLPHGLLDGRSQHPVRGRLRPGHPEVPPRVEYEISDLGLSLAPLFAHLAEWAAANLPAVEQARRDYGGASARQRLR